MIIEMEVRRPRHSGPTGDNSDGSTLALELAMAVSPTLQLNFSPPSCPPPTHLPFTHRYGS